MRHWKLLSSLKRMTITICSCLGTYVAEGKTAPIKLLSEDLNRSLDLIWMPRVKIWPKVEVHWYGVGHNSAYSFKGKDYFFSHAYDAKDDGRPKLVTKQIKWVNGWPKVKPMS